VRQILVIASLLVPLAGFAAEDIQQVEGLVVDSVLVYGSVEAEISQGEPTMLLIRGSESELEPPPFFVTGSTLVLGRSKLRDWSDAEYDDVKFKLILPELQSLALSGSGQVYLQPFTVEDLSLSLDGSGEIRVFAIKGQSVNLTATGSGDILLAEVDVQSLEIVRAGSGDIGLGELTVEWVTASISGSGDISAEKPASAVKLNMNVIGSGDMNFGKIDANDVEVNIMGSGTARVGASSTMEANIVGSGDIYYRGNPDIDQSILGSGDLHQQD
jgi:hypothetical protein